MRCASGLPWLISADEFRLSLRWEGCGQGKGKTRHELTLKASGRFGDRGSGIG